MEWPKSGRRFEKVGILIRRGASRPLRTLPHRTVADTVATAPVLTGTPRGPGVRTRAARWDGAGPGR